MSNPNPGRYPMRHRLTLSAVALVMATIGLSAPADAAPTRVARAGCPDGTCQNVTHAFDEGYDAAFLVEGIKYRSDGSIYTVQGYIAEGQSAYGNGFASAERIYVNAGTQIKCKDPVLLAYGITKWQIQWDSTGWHSVGTYPLYSSYTCVYQLD